MTGTIVWFGDESCRESSVAGGKGASLAEMTRVGLPVPPGFAITAAALERAIDGDRLRAYAMAESFADAQALVASAEPPRAAIISAYERLGCSLVAVRSSATAEDSEAASYAGQQETYLGVEGADQVVLRVVECWASFFSERAIFYRKHKGSLDDLAMAVVVQSMVDAEKAGVMFTADPVQRRRDRIVIEAIHGVGEALVAGEVTPDHYVVDRGGTVKKQIAPADVLAPDELARLARLGCRVEEHFEGPQDVEWAIVAGEVFLLQSRPITTL